MKLYFFPIAPNPTRVRLYIAEKRAGGAKLDVTEEVVSLLEGEQNEPEHLARNPFGNLPVLEFDDGGYLRESLCIIDYLEDLHPDPPMFGSEPRERARVRMLERTAELGVLHSIARIVHSTNSPLGLPPNPGMAEYFRSVLPRALSYLDDELADGRAFVAGASPTVADCTLQAAFQFGRFGGAELDPAYENLARWDQAYRERETAKSVLVT